VSRELDRHVARQPRVRAAVQICRDAAGGDPPVMSVRTKPGATAFAEFHRYPLRVQQSKLDGWWFIFIDEVPGLGVVGQNYEDLLDRLKVIAGNLFRARGETVTDIKIIPSEKPALQVFH
jgi:predicted RNase H-like HicB family nuclease